MPIEMKVSEYIAAFLQNNKIAHVFEVAGGMITHLLDAMYQLGDTTIVSVHHEQAAAFAADAYGRVTGKPGVALATSGPGATNLLTGIASCFFDSSPALFITGQVNVHEQKGARAIRQLGFQETDIVTMAQPITKQSFRITHQNQVEAIMQEAYVLAISGRPGPVLIDIPMNIQRERIIVAPLTVIAKATMPNAGLSCQLALVEEYLMAAKRPLLLLGGGVHCAESENACLEFINHMGLPVVTSLQGLDLIPYHHPLRVGFIGTYGNRWANITLADADVLLVIGSRLDVRQTGADVDSFRQNKTIIHVDCDAGEINNRVQNCIAIVADAKDFFIKANATLKRIPVNHAWLDAIATAKQRWPDSQELQGCKGINPNHFMHALSQMSEPAMGYVADVGSHQMWAAQSLEIAAHQCFITSGGMGAMGFALPAAIGASLARNKAPIVVIVGDGALQMNIQELQTVVRNRIPLKIVVMNNNCLGMIRQFQDSYFDGRHQSTCWGYSAPDFQAIAQAYGLQATTIRDADTIHNALRALWEKPEEPAVLQVMISSDINVYPKIAFGRPIREMEPYVLPIAIEST